MPIKLLVSILLLSNLGSCSGQHSESPSIIGKKVKTITTNPLVIFQDSKFNYWFGGGKGGVYKLTKALDPGKNDILLLYSEEDGLCSSSVIGIQEDRYGNIYFDTTEGVCKFDGTQFSTLEITEKTDTFDQWFLNPNDLWFRMGWEGNGPYRYDGESLYALKFPLTNEARIFYEEYPDASWSPFGIYSMYRDSKGRMWFGTSASGICTYDGSSLKWLYEDHLTTTPEGGDFGIRSILEDNEGKFWFCNAKYRYHIFHGYHKEKGVPYINYKTDVGVAVKYEDSSINHPYFMSMVKDNDGALWMATYDEGVYKLDETGLFHYSVQSYGKSVTVFSIYKDRLGKIWMGTHNGGPMFFNGESFIPLRPEY